MSLELVYTSAPRGLAPGSHGFCTVACTRDMPRNLTQQLESLSGYRQIYSPQDPSASLNPVAFSHLMLTVAGRPCHVLSRVCDAGLDYTQRTNKFAHHVVLDTAEAPAGGPAWLLASPGFMQTKWEGEPSILPAGPVVPLGESPPRVCRAWQQRTGDAGWGGVLAETVVGGKLPQAVLIFRPTTDILALLAESLALLPAELRWGVTFSTYFTRLPPGVTCQWRCVVDGTPEAAAARHGAQSALVIDLCRPLGQAVGGAYVDAARTGNPGTVPIFVSAKMGLSPLTSREAADAELEYALQQPVVPPSVMAAGLRVPAGATAGEYPLRPPAAPAVRPPSYGEPIFQRKPAPRWPWVFGIAAMILILVVGGFVTNVIMEKKAESRSVATKAAEEKAAAKKKTAEQKRAAENTKAEENQKKKAAEEKPVEEKPVEEKPAPRKQTPETKPAEERKAPAAQQPPAFQLPTYIAESRTGGGVPKVSREHCSANSPTTCESYSNSSSY